jgi:hypothetical protein
MDPTIVTALPALATLAQATALAGQGAAPADLPTFQVVNPLVEAVAQNALAPGNPNADIVSNFIFDPQTQEIIFQVMDVNTRQVFFQVPEAARQRATAFDATLAANAGVGQNQVGTA